MPIAPKMREFWHNFKNQENGPSEVPWADRVMKIFINYLTTTSFLPVQLVFENSQSSGRSWIIRICSPPT